MSEEKLLARKAELEKELQIGVDFINNANAQIQEKSIIVHQIRGALMVLEEFLKPEEKKDIESE